MNELEQVLQSYLEAPETDYAIMISGAWGCGKTYYIRHGFVDLVKKIKVPRSGAGGKKEEVYSPAFVSLYGVSSVEDFEYNVFCGIHSWAGSQLGRVASWLGSKLAERGGLSVEKKDLNDFLVIGKNRVLVFDDLERICEDKVPLKEILGLINTYAEHSHLKVIVVCNEDKFLSKEANPALKEAYLKYKEKSIRFTYSFVPDVEAVYDAIVSGIPEGEYKDYLTQEKKSVLSLFDLGGESNLRTLKFFIDTFGRIYDFIQFKDPDSTARNYKKQRDRLYLVSYMLYTLEYKRGHFKADLDTINSRQNYSGTPSIFGNLHGNLMDNEGHGDSFQSVFIRRYANVLSDFRPNPVLQDYIQSGYLDKSALLLQIFKLNQEFNAQTTTVGGMYYQFLSKMEELADGQATPLIKNSLALVRADKYNLNELLRLIVLLLKYDYWHIEGFELTDEIEQEFKASMERLKTTHVYDSTFGLQVPILVEEDLSNESKERYDTLRLLASRINRFARDKDQLSKCQHFVEIAEKGDEYELRKYRSDPKNAITVNGMDWGKVGNVILNSKNQVACEVCECIISFIPTAEQLNDDEIIRIKNDFLPVLNEYLDSEKTQIRKVFIAKLRNHLDSIFQDKSVSN